MSQPTFLTPYAPFVQLMAGAYLLFFYSSMLKRHRPLGSSQKRMILNLQDISTLINAYISMDVFNRDLRRLKASWIRYREAVGAVARFSFLYTVAFLVYAGIEVIESKTGLTALIIDGSMYGLYTLLTLTLLQNRFLKSWECWIIGLVLMIVVGILFPPADVSLNWPFAFLSTNTTAHILCGISVFAFISATIRFYMDEWHCILISHDIHKVGTMINDLNVLDNQLILNQPRETQMILFHRDYRNVLNMDRKWKYSVSEESATLTEWKRLHAIYVRKEYGYWVRTISGSIKHSSLKNYGKLCTFKEEKPMECIILLFFLIFVILLMRMIV